MPEQRNKDFAEKETDRLLEELEEKIYEVYKQAYEEASKKFQDKSEAFAKKDGEMWAKYESGAITEKEYFDWRRGYFFQKDLLSKMADELGEDLVTADQKAMSIANGYMPEAYALNFNYETYDIEQNTQINTSFTLYSRESVERLIASDRRKLLPKRKVDIPKDKIWNVKHLKNEITQGILQGKSIPDIAKGLRRVTDMDRKASIRNARTMMTGAQNGGRLDAMKRASDLGIKIQKEWMATLDDRTRDSHQHMDGERVGITRYFSNGLQYPGDPNGRPEEVYNCRCTMVSFYPEYADIIEKRMTYSEWAQTRAKEPENEPEAIIEEEKPKVLNIDHKEWLKKVYNDKYTEEDIEELSQAYANAPEELQKLYEKYKDGFLEMEDISGGGYFWAYDKRVHFNSEHDRKETDGKPKFQTSSHELGHNVDFLANGSKRETYLSNMFVNKNGMTFKDIIYEDWNNFFLSLNNAYGNSKEVTGYLDVFNSIVGRKSTVAKNFIDELLTKANNIANGSNGNIDLQAKTGRAMGEFLRMSWKRTSVSDYRTFYLNNKDIFESIAPSRWVTIDKETLRHFCDDMITYTAKERADISDMFEQYCIMHGGDEYPFGWGHGKDYAFRMGSLEKEAFAEMMSATLVNEDSLRTIKQYLPNSYEAFLEMMKGATE